MYTVGHLPAVVVPDWSNYVKCPHANVGSIGSVLLG